MEWQAHIASDKEVLLGKPVIKNTRISVEFLLELLSNGWTEAMILESYSQLKPLHMQAVFSFKHRKGLS